jgi:type VI secretion system protein ImpA
MSDSAAPTIVDTWLEPLSDGSCGADPEYDNDFQVELTKAVNGKPGDQFSPEGEPPNWRAARSLCESIFERCRDVRVAIAWARAMVNTEGALSVADSLRLVHGLLERHWDTVHPMPDDGDAYARVNALNDMCTPAGLLGDLRQALVVRNRTIGEVRGRDVEIALGMLEPRSDDPQYGKGQIQQIFAAAADADPDLRGFATRARGHLDKLNDLMREKVGYSSAPTLTPLIEFFQAVESLMPGELGNTGNLLHDAGITDASAGAPAPRARSSSAAAGPGLSGSIDTRLDALRAIDMVCEYLERTEPTNPAQLLLRRARKLVDKNFLELVREFAPQSVEEVARILGVSPEEHGGSSY